MTQVVGFLADVAEVLVGGGAMIDARGDHLSFRSVLGTTHVQLPSSEDVLVTTPLSPEEAPDLLAVSAINSLSALSALVKDEKTGGVTLSTRVRREKGMSEKVLAGFVATVALLQAPTMLGNVKLRMKQPNEPLDLAGRDESILGIESEFENAHGLLKDLGHLSFADGKGLTAELGWSKEEHTATLGHRTNLLEFNETLVHPVLGRGLAYRLKMQVAFATNQVASFANFLNHSEMDGHLPSCPGAWGEAGSDSLAFSGFVPTFCYASGLAALLSMWLVRKHNSATWCVKELVQRQSQR